MHNIKGLFKRFFNKYFCFGIVIILISIILECIVPKCTVQNIAYNTFRTIGIALMIGSIFDFSKNSNDFMEFVSNLLKDIIISKNFLNGLDDKEKKKALEMILRPSGNQLDQCSDIGLYFKKKVDDTMGMFHTNFKTNLVVRATAKKGEQKVVVDIELAYRVYKIEDKYFPVVTTFDRNGGNVEKTYIITEDSTIDVEERLKEKENENDDVSPINVKTYEFVIPEELYKYPYLTIRKTAKEEGYDHWTNFHWNTLTPTDGINFTLECKDDLSIKEYFIFDNEELYSVDESEDKKKISIVSSMWLYENSGFVFTISDT